MDLRSPKNNFYEYEERKSYRKSHIKQSKMKQSQKLGETDRILISSKVKA